MRAAGKTRRAQRQNRLEAEEETNTILSVLKVESPQSTHPITVTVEVNGRYLSMEIDMGVAVSIILRETWKKLFPEASLKPSAVLLKTYTGEPMLVVGVMEVQVNYELQSHKLPLLVVAGKGPSLIGHDWLQHIQLNWRDIGITTLDNGQAQAR